MVVVGSVGPAVSAGAISSSCTADEPSCLPCLMYWGNITRMTQEGCTRLGQASTCQRSPALLSTDPPLETLVALPAPWPPAPLQPQPHSAPRGGAGGGGRRREGPAMSGGPVVIACSGSGLATSGDIPVCCAICTGLAAAPQVGRGRGPKLHAFKLSPVCVCYKPCPIHA